MGFQQKLRSLRLRKELTQKELSRMVGVSEITVRNWEAGTKNPSMSAIIALSGCLHVSADELLCISGNLRDIPDVLNRSERALLNGYRALDSCGKTMVDTVCRLERRRVENSASTVRAVGTDTKRRDVRYIPCYLLPAAAGYSAPIDEDEYEMILANDRIPAEADFAVKIQGTSMEPWIEDQSVVYAQRVSELAVGEIGVFVVNGAMYCKHYCPDDNGNLWLVSANPDQKHTNVYVSAESGDCVQCFGRVLLQDRTPLPEYFLESLRGVSE